MDKLEKPQIIVHVQKGLNYTAYDAKWIPCSARFVVLGSHPKGTGAMQIYEVSRGSANLLKDVEKKASFKCGTFGASSLQQRHLATGDFEGKLMIWDLEKTELPVYSVKAHEEIINCINGVGGASVGEGAPELVTGSRDGSVKVWDPRQKDEPVANMEPGAGQDRRDCWCVAFGNAYNADERTVATGYDNGDIKLFDLKNMSLRWETNVKNGVCDIQFDRRDILMNKLVATTLESKFFLWDMRTQHPSKGFAMLSEKAHSSTIWCVRHLPQNREVFMTCGGSGSLNLWKYFTMEAKPEANNSVSLVEEIKISDSSYPAKRVLKDGEGQEMGAVGSVNLLQNVNLSSQPVSSLDWSPDKEGLAVCTSFDQTVRVLIVTKLDKA